MDKAGRPWSKGLLFHGRVGIDHEIGAWCGISFYGISFLPPYFSSLGAFPISRSAALTVMTIFWSLVGVLVGGKEREVAQKKKQEPKRVEKGEE
jgi:hypothetical protein